MERRWHYKNFNMVVELDVAGEFIYNGIHDIYSLNYFSNDGCSFSAFYNISVGIERLQKIVYVLWALDSYSQDDDFEKSIITHSHTKLRDMINEIMRKESINLRFSERENDFFELIRTFYNNARYMRFNIEGDWNKELTIIRSFAKKYDLLDEELDIYPDSYLVATSKMKEFIGRTVGGIAKKYYEVIKKGSDRNNTFTYELRSDSKAEKVFLGEYTKNSLMKLFLDESTVYKELLVFFRNTKCKDAFLRFVDEIEPLDFDPVMVVEYLEEIIKGNIPQMLVDDVECMYEEYGYSRDRINLMEGFANSDVYYDYPVIREVWVLLNKIASNTNDISDDFEAINQLKDYIREEDIVIVVENALEIINMYREQLIDEEKMKKKIRPLIQEYKEFLIN